MHRQSNWTPRRAAPEHATELRRSCGTGGAGGRRGICSATPPSRHCGDGAGSVSRRGGGGGGGMRDGCGHIVEPAPPCWRFRVPRTRHATSSLAATTERGGRRKRRGRRGRAGSMRSAALAASRVASAAAALRSRRGDATTMAAIRGHACATRSTHDHIQTMRPRPPRIACTRASPPVIGRRFVFAPRS
ncbi:hypothetical protein BC834DRAFT_853390 [Gloeopeniophorella convolvens]|nr:hypothetical protein BC834DRAFT_853390 [Gloeopeniophorella convolvens]